ncbi:cysteine--1-D-myo-inosityl 2-amino-2-deoxy-alpha-D-glucopyranoside ligase [Salana multivorans]
MRSWSTPSRPVLPAPEPGHAIAVRDSASGELTTVGEERRGALYVCGITPYDATHLGHAATYLTFDLLVRAWLDAGIPVSYAQNVTDIDDPLLERAAERGEDWRAIAERETELFRSDMTALRVIPPTSYVGAVELIPDVARVVERLLAEGRAYRVGPDADGQGDGDVYADLSTDPRVGRDTADLDPAANLARFLEIGGDPERPGKRDGLDPLLWRVERPGEPSWDGGELGPGRPGWHIECAVIAGRELGAPFDVQGGGADLRFPHHAYSASHLRALSGVARPVRAHVHAGLVGYEGHKMSKSRGNLVLVSRLLRHGVDPMAIRLAVLAHHYATPWEFTDADLETAVARLARWREAVALPAGPSATEVLSGVRAALAADLDGPTALGVVDEWVDRALAGAANEHGANDDDAAPGLVRDTVDALLGIAL